MYTSLYDELNRRVPFLPETAQQQSADGIVTEVSPEWLFFRRFLQKETTLLEIGTWNFVMPLAAAKLVKKVYAKEYTNKDLSDLFKKIGFSKVKAYFGAMGMYVRCPLFALRFLEGLLDKLPARICRTVASLLLLVNIRLVGVKK